MIAISVASRVYVACAVSALVPLGTQPVKIALLRNDPNRPPATPETADWQVAEWTAGTMPNRTDAYGRTIYTQVCQVLVGPGGGAVTLTPGMWSVWALVDDTEVEPVLPAGQLVAF